MPLAPGTRLGPYEIVSPLGAGGMGEVYRARDTRLERTVALKILPPRLAEDPELRQRFEREARAISALNHPHICVLHDVGRQDGIDFLVMEHLEGQTLSDRLKKGALPLDQVLRYGVEIAEALERAHRQGIVHRDLKPGNVMLTKTGTKLLDFGLAKVRPARPAEEHEPTLTEAGELLGTPRYMAPEQLEGKEPDARTDIFALGTVLYEMATGQRAFPATSQAGAITAILSTEPAAISKLRPGTSPALDRAVATCLAKDPDDRWQSSHDLAAELRWIAEAGSAAGGAAPGAAGRRSRDRLAAGAAALVGIALVWTVSHRGERPEKSLRVRLEVRAPEKEPFGDQVMAVSPDGERIVFAASSEGKTHLYVRALDSLTPTRIPGTEEGLAPFWAPDGRQIGFMTVGGRLKKIDLSGGPAQVLCENEIYAFLGGSWSPQGTIVFSASGELFRLAAAGGAPTPLGRRTEGESSRSWPEFLPDGRHYLYLSQDARPEKQGIYLASVDSEERKRILATGYDAVYASSGHLLFERGGALVAQVLDMNSLELSGEAFTVIDPRARDPYNAGTSAVASPAVYSVSSNGVLAWRIEASPTSNSLTWFDRAGKKLGTLAEPANYSNPALSPDERSLAVEQRDPQTRMRDIWIFDLVRGARSRLTFDPAEDLGATWSPDGARIVFTSDRRGSREIYEKLANGSGGDELLLESKDRYAHAEDRSPDGRFLLFNWQGGANQFDLFVLPLSSGRDRKPVPFLATPFREEQGQFSPDGRFLAYRSDESGRRDVYVREVSPDGTAGPGKWQVSTDGGAEPRWRRDGKELFYMSGPAAASDAGGPGTLMAVPLKTDGASFEPGVPKPLFEVRLPEQRRNRFVVTRDGQRFLVNTALEGTFQPIQVLVNWLPSK